MENREHEWRLICNRQLFGSFLQSHRSSNYWGIAVVSRHSMKDPSVVPKRYWRTRRIPLTMNQSKRESGRPRAKCAPRAPLKEVTRSAFPPLSPLITLSLLFSHVSIMGRPYIELLASVLDTGLQLAPSLQFLEGVSPSRYR